MDMGRGEERVRCMGRVRKKKDQLKYSSSLSLLEKLQIINTLEMCSILIGDKVMLQ